MLVLVFLSLICKMGMRSKMGMRRTVRINTQRRIPAAMTNVPPEKRIRSSSFSRRGRRALNRI